MAASDEDSGPFPDDPTPVARNTCPRCGAHGFTRISDAFPPPKDKDDAKVNWPKCVATQMDVWWWCLGLNRLCY